MGALGRAGAARHSSNGSQQEGLQQTGIRLGAPPETQPWPSHKLGQGARKNHLSGRGSSPQGLINKGSSEPRSAAKAAKHRLTAACSRLDTQIQGGRQMAANSETPQALRAQPWIRSRICSTDHSRHD